MKQSASTVDRRRAERELTMGDHFDYLPLRKELIFAARAVGRDTFQVLIKWALDYLSVGAGLLIRSSNRHHLERNLDSFDWRLPPSAIGPILSRPLAIAKGLLITSVDVPSSPSAAASSPSDDGPMEHRISAPVSSGTSRARNRRNRSGRTAAELRDMLLASRQQPASSSSSSFAAGSMASEL